MADQSPSANDRGRVIRFRPRKPDESEQRSPSQRGQPDEPVADLSQFERTDREDDYRHRMRMNALALVATAILIATGVWLTVSITEMQKSQDCFLQGRRNCNPPVPPPPGR